MMMIFLAFCLLFAGAFCEKEFERGFRYIFVNITNANSKNIANSVAQPRMGLPKRDPMQQNVALF
jgi:hypothetical protein